MILAIDPGNEYTAYVIVSDDMSEIADGGKITNGEMLEVIEKYLKPHEISQYYHEDGKSRKVAIEMLACYGMAVGKTVFETCVFVGQLKQIALSYNTDPTFIYRKDEKMTLCHSMQAKDSNIRQALIDRYAKFDFKNGKGTKKEPDFFYGFKADMWAAFAVAHAFKELHL